MPTYFHRIIHSCYFAMDGIMEQNYCIPTTIKLLNGSVCTLNVAHSGKTGLTSARINL